MPAPLLVVVTGQPASGKTTLARRLAADLALPLFARDDLKEQLFADLGWSDRDWSRRLGRASYGLLFLVAGKLLAAGQSLLVESNFAPGLAEPDLGRLSETTGCRFFIVHCRAEPTVLRRRFQERWRSGERHPGHVDDVSLAELDERLGADPRLTLAAPLVVVDTTEPVRIDHAGLIALLRRELAGPSMA
jgi:predicted kinase